VIQEAVFKTFGCGSAIASSSYMTEIVKGLTLEDASKIKNTTIAQELALPPVKLHCSSTFPCLLFSNNLTNHGSFSQCLPRMLSGLLFVTTAPNERKLDLQSQLLLVHLVPQRLHQHRRSLALWFTLASAIFFPVHHCLSALLHIVMPFFTSILPAGQPHTNQSKTNY
jgi:hypothetical protein